MEGRKEESEGEDVRFVKNLNMMYSIDEYCVGAKWRASESWRW